MAKKGDTRVSGKWNQTWNGKKWVSTSKVKAPPSSRQQLASEIQRLNPEITPELIKSASALTGFDMLKEALSKPSSTEAWAGEELKNLKSDTQIQAEQSAAFDAARQASQTAMASAPALQNAFTAALGGAAGGFGAFAGGNTAGLIGLGNAGQEGAADVSAGASNVQNIGFGGMLAANLLAAEGTAKAKSARDISGSELRKEKSIEQDRRRMALLEAKSKYPSNLLSGISSLLGFKPKTSGGYGGGGGSGTGGTDWQALYKALRDKQRQDRINAALNSQGVEDVAKGLNSLI